MRIHAHRNVALHSASSPGGLINVPMGRTANVPDDVNDHPQIKMLKKSSYISVLKDKAETKKLEVEIPVDEELDDEDDDDDNPLMKSSGRDGDAGDWTQWGRDATGYPVKKGSPEDVSEGLTGIEEK